jgi:hypothetical protein
VVVCSSFARKTPKATIVRMHTAALQRNMKANFRSNVSLPCTERISQTTREVNIKGE